MYYSLRLVYQQKCSIYRKSGWVMAMQLNNNNNNNNKNLQISIFVNSSLMCNHTKCLVSSKQGTGWKLMAHISIIHAHIISRATKNLFEIPR